MRHRQRKFFNLGNTLRGFNLTVFVASAGLASRGKFHSALAKKPNGCPPESIPLPANLKPGPFEPPPYHFLLTVAPPYLVSLYGETELSLADS